MHEVSVLEKTACADGYWPEMMLAHEAKHLPEPKCFECTNGVWHGRFPKQSAVGMLLASDGFLYSKESAAIEAKRFAQQSIRIICEVA